jgi:hypothetical protein
VGSNQDRILLISVYYHWFPSSYRAIDPAESVFVFRTRSRTNLSRFETLIRDKARAAQLTPRQQQRLLTTAITPHSTITSPPPPSPLSTPPDFLRLPAVVPCWDFPGDPFAVIPRVTPRRQTGRVTHPRSRT